MTLARWEEAGVVRGFSTAAANPVLLEFVRVELARRPGLRVVDLGCGAARNAAPMAALGATVIGTDLARPMLEAARRRASAEGVGERASFACAPMDAAPLRDASVDLVVAHGIWNLARSAAEMRRAMAEAARVARPGAGLFVFTFSRDTLAPGDRPVPGETFVFTQFAGEPQCFLTESQLKEELLRAGFEKDPPGPLTKYNRPASGRSLTRGAPVIYEGTFRRRVGVPSRSMEEEDVLEALRQVLDPELGINVVDLGLVYRVAVEGTRVEVVLTMTSPACPLGGQLTGEAEAAVRRAAPAAAHVDVRLVLDPPWHPRLMTDAARRRFGWSP